MATLDFSRDQLPFDGLCLDAANTIPANPPTTTANPMQDELFWGLNPLSPSLSFWNAETERLFAKQNFDFDNPKDSCFQYGQLTPPCSFEDAKLNPSVTLSALEQTSPMAIAPSTAPHHPPRRSFSEESSECDSASPKRRKSQHTKQSAPCASSSEAEDQKPKSRRERVLERNRVAAKKCRQKKKTQNAHIESRFKEQATRKECLMADVDRLRSEVLDLRNEMLKHAQCDNEPIKRHLAQMVRRITHSDISNDSAIATQTPPESSSKLTERSSPPALSVADSDDLVKTEPADPRSTHQHTRTNSDSSFGSDSSYNTSADEILFDELIDF